MKKGIILTAMAFSMVIYLLPSCYQNKEDILELPRVSFRTEVVPIMTAGPCGCHNNGTTRAIQFSHLDTVFYDAILGRVSLFKTWVNGGIHPGGGAIDFAPNEKNIVKRWLDQGDPYDNGAGCTVTGPQTYTKNILPIYTITCKGATCHGGIAIALDYAKMVTAKTALTTIMNTGGAQGHPGGALSLTTCTINIFKEWLAQGQPQ
ncbi:MAG: hypothetical protein IPP93_15235 [Chitinophagaceae bacterium]|nr:hypothetical protein [Chitinophagaceae bacterium]MBL0337171.1 hypothetical protein [Chitinophagaceae bacterium]